MWDEFWVDRGEPWDHDPGPSRSGDWARLFAQTPDYRALGVETLGREAFRWHFGPMFYRGRLGGGQARVLIIGQEGAQDESLAHRSFVGGTGARMQHLLRWIGLTRSYLFLNTFVYPIFGQYGTDLRPLAQDRDSPIVEHRHEILELAARTHNLDLVISVGTAARETVQTWARMRGGSLPPGIRSVGVVHPGALSPAVRRSFARAVEQIAGFAEEDDSWLPPDSDGRRRFGEPFVFGAAPVPFADLPFGAPWRLGRGGTSSNRKDGQTGIQLFSAAGEYDNRGVPLSYVGSAAGSTEGYEDEPGDLPYEPPRRRFGDFDRGPGADWARLSMGGEPGLDWPDFRALGLTAHPSLGFGPILRGRPRDAVLAVLCDQESHDDLFSGRAASGEAGQRLQRLLAAAGLRSKYLILRVLPVDGEGAGDRLPDAVRHPQVERLYAAMLSRAERVRALLALGPRSRGLARRIGGDLLLVEAKAAFEPDWLPSWRAALSELEQLDLPRDGAASFEYDGERGQISRLDLPYGTMRWQGSSGDRARKARRSGRPSPDYFKLSMPGWTESLPP